MLTQQGAPCEHMHATCTHHTVNYNFIHYVKFYSIGSSNWIPWPPHGTERNTTQHCKVMKSQLSNSETPFFDYMYKAMHMQIMSH